MKKKMTAFQRCLAMVLCLSMAFSSSIVFSTAEESAENQTPPTDLNIGEAEDSAGNRTPPPELIIGEGEVWVPDAVDPRTVLMRGSDDECRHGGGSPANYRYIGAVRGNTTADVAWVSAATSTMSLFLPAPFGFAFSVFSAVSGLAQLVFPGDTLEGNYIKHQYVYNVGPDPNLYWFHTFFDFATINGKPVGSACYATYSPKKPGDYFQD